MGLTKFGVAAIFGDISGNAVFTRIYLIFYALSVSQNTGIMADPSCPPFGHRI
jgi:hypothetical protein